MSVSTQSLLDWAETPAGRYALTWEMGVLDQVVSDIFGFHALQLGLPMVDALRCNRMPFALYGLDHALLAKQSAEFSISQSFLNETVHEPQHLNETFFTLDYTNLPFAAQSLDLVVLPHVLDFSNNPHEVLREVERVLMPEGYVVLTGFNPKSLWGMRRKSSRHKNLFPQGSQWISLRRVKDWLQLLGFELQQGKFGCYAPLCASEEWIQRYRWLEKAGDRWWAVAGAIYMLVAIKRQNAIRLIGPVWRNKQAKAQALAPLANRGRNYKL